MKIKIVISGCLGRMGQRIAHLALEDEDIELIAGIEREGHSELGKDLAEVIGAGRKNILISSNIEDVLPDLDILVEFSNPAATIEHLEAVSRFKKKMVIGTTGFKKEQTDKIEKLAQNIAVLISPNMSIGVNVLFKIVPQIVKLLGEDYDIEIVELHHNKKKDAPSGTAQKIAQLIKDTRRNLKFIYGREGLIGERDKNELALHSLRLGNIVGEHRIIFAGNDEKIELIHSAGSRDIFARGVIYAIKYLQDKKKGLFTMEDVLAQRAG